MLDATDPQVVKLSARVFEPIETPAELALATECLESAWEWVRIHGALEWDYLDPSTPGIARTVALNAAARCYDNPSGYIEERGDSVQFKRGDDFAKGSELTAAEVAALKRSTNTHKASIVSVPLSNPDTYQPRRLGRERRYQQITVGVGDVDHRPITFYDWRLNG